MAGWTTGDIYTPKGDYKFPDYSGSFKQSGGSPGSRSLSEGATAAVPFLKNFIGGRSRGQSSSGSVMMGDYKPVGGSTSTGGMNQDLTIVHHPSTGQPMVMPGTPAKEGIGSKLGKLALGVGVGALTGGWGGAALGGLQGAGSFFED